MGLRFPDIVGENGGAFVINLEDPADELILLNELAQRIRLRVFVHSKAFSSNYPAGILVKPAKTASFIQGLFRAG